MSHKAVIDDKYGDIDGRSSTCVDPHRDVVKEITSFGPAPATKTATRACEIDPDPREGRGEGKRKRVGRDPAAPFRRNPFPPRLQP